jgi:hypothetical protein
MGHRATPSLLNLLQDGSMGVVNAQPYTILGRAVPSRDSREAKVTFTIHKSGQILD